MLVMTEWGLPRNASGMNSARRACSTGSGRSGIGIPDGRPDEAYIASLIDSNALKIHYGTAPDAVELRSVSRRDQPVAHAASAGSQRDRDRNRNHQGPRATRTKETGKALTAPTGLLRNRRRDKWSPLEGWSNGRSIKIAPLHGGEGPFDERAAPLLIGFLRFCNNATKKERSE